MKTVIEIADEVFDQMPLDGHCREPYWTATEDELQRFAELIRADAIAEERDACAKVADHWRDTDDWPCGDGIGRAIRARGATNDL